MNETFFSASLRLRKLKLINYKSIKLFNYEILQEL